MAVVELTRLKAEEIKPKIGSRVLNSKEELLSGELQEGQEIVVNMVTGLEPPRTPGQQGGNNPLMQQPQRGPGNRGGGGPGRGR